MGYMRKRLDTGSFQAEVVDQASGKTIIEDVDSEKVKTFYANILGNSNVIGREFYERNKLGDKIVEEANGSIDLTIPEYEKVVKSIETFQGIIPRSYRELVYRIFEAKEIVEDKVK